MSVKSTRCLSRSEAESRYVAYKLDSDQLRRLYRAEAALMSDTELEDAIEELNDSASGGEGFENYRIRD